MLVDDLKREFLSSRQYLERFLAEQGEDPHFIENEENIRKHGNQKQKLELISKQMQRHSKYQQIDQEVQERYAGAWFRKYQTQTDKLEETDEFTKTRQPGKMLDDFIGDRQHGADDSDAEEDIYRQYQDMASRTAEQQPVRPDFAGFTPSAETLRPKLPGFEDYFKAEADGVHPFDSIAESFDSSELGTEDDHAAERQREEVLYKRQLLGKLMGQRLTTAEYELVDGFYQNQDLRQKRQLDTNNEEFLENRQVVRLLQERVERIRRQKVMTGEWTESESHQRLQTMLEQDQEKYLSGPDPEVVFRDTRRFMAQAQSSITTDMLAEKEYHFDEGLGVSLAEHVRGLKDQYPGVTISTRRDRDGFAIVKVSFKPEFKYDLDRSLEQDTEQLA